MPRRPKLWIHRTRRFWVGLGLLVFLLALFLVSGEGKLELEVRRSAVHPGRGLNLFHENQLKLRCAGGGVTLSYVGDEYPTDSSSRPVIWEFKSDFDRKLSGLQWLPEFQKNTRDGRRGFLPLWPLPVLWAILWITRMVRAERRELKKWSGSLQEP